MAHNNRHSIVEATWHGDEATVVRNVLIRLASLPTNQLVAIQDEARQLVDSVRNTEPRPGALDAFLHEFGLSTKEGVGLLCLAEALLRIPDAATADLLIRDKIAGADWSRHLGRTDSLFVNASTWALMLTGRVIRLDDGEPGVAGSVLDRLLMRAGEPVIRQAMIQAMRILGRQFVMGRTIEEALERARGAEQQGWSHSYDMLGEAARTGADAERHMQLYTNAVAAVGQARAGRMIDQAAGVSVKLSALHPRYEMAQRDWVLRDLVPKLLHLAQAAATAGIHLTIDAEEAERLELSLDVIGAVVTDKSLGTWAGFGLAVQAYQRRALPLLDRLEALARHSGRRLMVRLVKGAYWDTEIKRAQERGLSDYPVFTRKVSTDVSYLACARRLLDCRSVIYPMFATHNAHTVAAVLVMAGDTRGFELQRLHGMGAALHQQLINRGLPVRIYAPVGGHEELLAYLVRRLLENGANSSFVNRIQDARIPRTEVVADPISRVAGLVTKPHPNIPLPRDLYGAERSNSAGLDLTNRATVAALLRDIQAAADNHQTAQPILDGDRRNGATRALVDPADNRRHIGSCVEATPALVSEAVGLAARAWCSWAGVSVDSRAQSLDRLSELIEAKRPQLMALLIREAGKTIADALAEVREAVDFCRYYAHSARTGFAPRLMPGPTGEENVLHLGGRGVFACISPWNFPLAIFTGQIVAALVAGNAVVAKPAQQTPLIAAMTVGLMHEAGIPVGVLHLLPGDGPGVGHALVTDPRITGVAFTGSDHTARLINRALAAREGAIVPLIAETGGQNAMIVDNSALPEQVVDDVMTSAFRSAGQRCSALRVLFVQDGIANRILDMLTGSASLQVLGDPIALATDIGPVIDRGQLSMLNRHIQRMRREARTIFAGTLPPDTEHGTFLAPHAFEIDRLDQLTGEVFGPVLHVIRWQGDHLDQVLNAISATGYGLTLGIHSRIDRTQRLITQRLGVGNTYINRNMVGAVVGTQPFGGEGRSGTGPKAGGPHYLTRFASERVITTNTTAAGGNTALISLGDTDAT